MLRLAACVSIIVPMFLIGVSDTLSQGLLDRLIDTTTDAAQRKAQDRVNRIATGHETGERYVLPRA